MSLSSWSKNDHDNLAFTCSKLIIKTLKQGFKYAQINNKNTRATPMVWFWCLYC